MDRDKFLTEMTTLLEREAPLSGVELLREIPEWDSLAVIGFITMLSKDLNKTVDPEEIRKCQTVNDLYKMAVQNGNGS